MKPELVPFTVEHMAVLVSRDSLMPLIKYGNRLLEGPAYTALLNGKPVGAAGIVISWAGNAAAWALLTDELVKPYPIWTTRIIRNALKDFIRVFNLRRIEMSVLSDRPDYQQWARLLGFLPENGCARKYTPDGKDVKRFELILE